MLRFRPLAGASKGRVLKVYRFRPALACIATAALCAVLEGATTSKAATDAGWPQCVAVLLFWTLPWVLLIGILLGFSASKEALQARGKLAGVFAGLGFFVSPSLAVLLDTPNWSLYGWGLTALTTLLSWVWLRFGPPLTHTDRFANWPLGPLGLFVGGFGLACAAVGLLTAGPEPEIGGVPGTEDRISKVSPAAPNLALIVLDTLRADRLGSYGYERPTSPFLDELAAQGILFERAIATGSHTPPTHASLFTGLLPSEHGVMSTHVGMPPEDRPTLAGRLKENGYAAIGVVANFVIRRAQRFSRGFHLYDDSLVCQRGMGSASEAVSGISATGRLWGHVRLFGWSPAKLFAVLFRPTEADVHAAAVNELVIDHLQDAHDKGGPWFLFVNYMDMHAPYQPPGEYMNKFLEHDPGDFQDRLRAREFNHRLNELTRRFEEGDERSKETLQALSDRYDGCLAYLDAQLREVFRFIELASGDRPWIVAITSDHGEEFGEHGAVGHGRTLWEGTQHVPLILVGSHLPAGRVSEPVSLQDIGTTFLSLAGVETPLGHGRTLAGIPAEMNAVVEEVADSSAARFPIAELGDARSRSFFAPLSEVAVYTQSFKWSLRMTSEEPYMESLGAYDLNADPSESSPLSGERLPRVPVGFEAWRERWLNAYQEGLKRTRYIDDSEASRMRLLLELGYK